MQIVSCSLGVVKENMKILTLVICLLFLVICLSFFTFRNEIKIARSVKKVKGFEGCYEMTFHDDYHFDEIMESNLSSDDEFRAVITGYMSHGFYKPKKSENKTTHVGCSTISAKNKNGSMIWGRNFDWYESVPIIIKSTPKNGYASISTCEFANITGKKGLGPNSFAMKYIAIASYYVPMDGINEKGLCVAELEVNEGGQKIVDTGKKKITVTMAIRLLLDKAATVDEAVALLEKYDICPSGNVSSHFNVSDASGKSVAVEFMDGKIIIKETECLTNFNLANGDINAGGENPKERYLLLKEIYSDKNGIMNKDDVKDALKKVSQTEGDWKTQWSIIYERNSSELSIDYYFNADFENKFTKVLKLKNERYDERRRSRKNSPVDYF